MLVGFSFRERTLQYSFFGLHSELTRCGTETAQVVKMLKPLLISVLLVVAHGANHICRIMNGNELTTFAGTRETIKFNCKFNMLKGTQCGAYKSITISPTLKLAQKGKSYVYVVDSLFVSATRNDGKHLSVRLDMQTVDKHFKSDKKGSSPLNYKGGSLKILEVYEVSDDGRNTVTLREKRRGSFTVMYQLYRNENPATSQMSFKCTENRFEPTGFLEQLCGNGEWKEITRLKEDKGLDAGTRAILVHSIFTSDSISQRDRDCSAVASRMSSPSCSNRNMQAAELCWPIFYSEQYIECFGGNEGSQVQPAKVFQSCVAFVCSGFTDASNCNKLKGYLQGCRGKLSTVSDMLDSVCGSQALSSDAAEDGQS